MFLLDEPFSNLDAGLRSRMRTEVKHLHLKLGTTSVFVTHDQEEAMSLSDFIAVMRDGTDRPVRADARDLQKAARPVRRDVRRQAQDEPRRRRALGRRGRAWRSSRRICGSRSVRPPRSACARGRSRASRWACVPRTCGSMPTAARPTPAARSRRPCSCWSRSGRTRSWSSRPATPRSSRGSRPMRASQIGQTVTAELTPGRIHLFERETRGADHPLRSRARPRHLP